MADWMDRSLVDIAAGLRSGAFSATDLAQEAIARHSTWDDRLKAYKTWDEEGLQRQASAADAAFAAGWDHGPLQGFPVSVKDIFGVAGLPIYGGTPNRLPAEWQTEGPMVRALRQSAATITGKTHTVEFAFGGLGVNSHWGTVRNPWDEKTHRVPGGSSAGAGVSLCEGSALLAYGSDTGGSVRIPASFTGNAGLKVTIGRWPTDGIIPLSTTYDTPGILARTVSDLAFAFAALDPFARGRRRPAAIVDAADLTSVRIGVTEDYFWEDLSSGIAEAVSAAIDEIAAAGAVRRAIPFPEAGALGGTAVGSIAGAEAFAFLSNELPDWLETLDPVVAPRIHAGGETRAQSYIDQRRLAHEQAALAQLRFSEIDVLCVPTVAVTPPALSEVSDADGYRTNNIKALRNTIPANLLELCAVTIPVGLDAAGMPVGMQVIAKGGNEGRLLSVALAFEAELGCAPDRLGRPSLGGAT